MPYASGITTAISQIQGEINRLNQRKSSLVGLKDSISTKLSNVRPDVNSLKNRTKPDSQLEGSHYTNYQSCGDSFANTLNNLKNEMADFLRHLQTQLPALDNSIASLEARKQSLLEAETGMYDE